jgi:hypothetical protein
MFCFLITGLLYGQPTYEEYRFKWNPDTEYAYDTSVKIDDDVKRAIMKSRSITKTYTVDTTQYIIYKYIDSRCPNGEWICQHGHNPISFTVFWTLEFGNIYSCDNLSFSPPKSTDTTNDHGTVLLQQLAADTIFCSPAK